MEAPTDTLAFLGARLRPASAPDVKRIVELINQLDSNRIKVRDRAMEELERSGTLWEPALEKIIADASTENRTKVEHLITQVPMFIPLEDNLQRLRAVETLERIGTLEAQKILQMLTKGAPEMRLTTEAKKSLERLKNQPMGGLR